MCILGTGRHCMPLLTVIFSSEGEMCDIFFWASIPPILHSIRKSEGSGWRTVEEVIRRNVREVGGEKADSGPLITGTHRELESQGQDQNHRSGKRMNALVFEEWLTGNELLSLWQAEDSGLLGKYSSGEYSMYSNIATQAFVHKQLPPLACPSLPATGMPFLPGKTSPSTCDSGSLLSLAGAVKDIFISKWLSLLSGQLCPWKLHNDATDRNTAVHILPLQLDGQFLKCSYFSFMFLVIA